jgi:hypothetical protein
MIFCAFIVCFSLFEQLLMIVLVTQDIPHVAAAIQGVVADHSLPTCYGPIGRVGLTQINLQNLQEPEGPGAQQALTHHWLQERSRERVMSGSGGFDLTRSGNVAVGANVVHRQYFRQGNAQYVRCIRANT